jgi:Luciferase-like monooxygenase
MTGDLPLLGFGLPVAGGWATPDTMRRTARRAEELGYASLWTFQRVLYPADGELDSSYRAVHDPVVPLAHVAGHTDRIGLGRRPSARPSPHPRCSRRRWRRWTCCLAAGSPSGSGSAGCRRSTPPPACPSSAGARGWTSTCAAWRRCGRRTRSSSPASSTPCRARTWGRRLCSDHTPRCCSAVRLRRHCAAPGGSPRAGSAAADRTSPGSARASRRCATARARPGATRRPCGSSCAASSTSSTTTLASSAGHSRGRASRCSTTSPHCARRASPRSFRPQLLAPGRLSRRRCRRCTHVRGARARRVRARERAGVARGRRDVPGQLTKACGALPGSRA